MKAQHTAAQWTISPTDTTSILDENGFCIAETTLTAVLNDWADVPGVTHWSSRPGVTYRDLSEEEAEANARLIAASPEMFEKLDYLTRYPLAMQNPGFAQEVRDLITKATAQAGGE